MHGPAPFLRYLVLLFPGPCLASLSVHVRSATGRGALLGVTACPRCSSTLQCVLLRDQLHAPLRLSLEALKRIQKQGTLPIEHFAHLLLAAVDRAQAHGNHGRMLQCGVQYVLVSPCLVLQPRDIIEVVA